MRARTLPRRPPGGLPAGRDLPGGSAGLALGGLTEGLDQVVQAALRDVTVDAPLDADDPDLVVALGTVRHRPVTDFGDLVHASQDRRRASASRGDRAQRGSGRAAARSERLACVGASRMVARAGARLAAQDPSRSRAMPEFQFQEMFPHGARHHALPPPRRRLGRPPTRSAASAILTVDGAALTRLAAEAVRDVSHLFRPGHLAQLRKILDDPEASANDRFVALNMLRNAVVVGRHGPAVVPGHRHRDRDRQEGPARLDRRRRRGGARARHLPDLHRDQPALLADGAAQHVRRGQHRHQPAGADRALRDRRATSTTSCSSPRAAARPTRRSSTRRPRRC